MTNPTITESVPDALVLNIMRATRDGLLTWQMGETLQRYIVDGKRELARDLLAAWLPIDANRHSTNVLLK